MARIRTVKPEFWTDEKIVQLPYEARLLFIGLWNFADDEGRLPDEPDRIKLQIFPADQKAPVANLLDLLVASDLLSRFVDMETGAQTLVVNGFGSHQKISHSTPSRISLENSRKFKVPTRVRREVAAKYGCKPGESSDVECYYCGMPGKIIWPRKNDGEPGYWVSFSLELDHFQSENHGGSTSCENIVLACRNCNRSKHTKDGLSHLLNILENSGEFHNTPEQSSLKGREGNGIEGKGIDLPTKEESLGGNVFDWEVTRD